MQHAWDGREVHRKLRSEDLKGRDHTEEHGVDGRIILKEILEK